MIVSLPLGAMCFFLYSNPRDTFTLIGLIVVGIWFILSLYDFFSSHKLLDWIYRKEEAKNEELN